MQDSPHLSKHDLILASASTIRFDMLTAAGVPVVRQPAAIDEDTIRDGLLATGETARNIADALAEAKALKSNLKSPTNLTLGADQVLSFEGRLFSKPVDLDDARDHLKQLRAKTHTLFSAAVVAEDGRPVFRTVKSVKLTMRPFSDEFLETYLATEGDTLLDCVGAYRLEGFGAQLFSRVDGDYFTVLGLPLFDILEYLRTRGLIST